MVISFHGAARTVTGSKHLLTLENGTKILLDCGMFQGMGAETAALNSSFGFKPSGISFLLLSHAHIDHSGLIPKLVKEGFTGKIICTEPTFHLTEILLSDSAGIQEHEAFLYNKNLPNGAEPQQPLYDLNDVLAAMALFEVLPYDKVLKLSPEISVSFTNTGHLIGAAAIHITIEEGNNKATIAYSGDVGRYRSALLQPPAVFPCADYIIIESTYGNKTHDPVFSAVDPLLKHIKKTCIDQQGKLIIPAFSVGRTQEILYALNQLELEKRLPPLKYYVDSPLSKKATVVIKNYMEHFNGRLQEILKTDDDPFDFEGLTFIDTAEESRELAASDEPCVIISASGTAESGRVKHHIAEAIAHKKNTILFVGYCQQESLGGKLLNGLSPVSINNEDHEVLAGISVLGSMSAHGDCDDLTNFISCQDVEKVKKLFIVHGEPECQEVFAEKLKQKGFANTVIPSLHEHFELN